MSEFEKIIQQDRRLVVLRMLAQDADYSHNEYILREALRVYGHRLSADLLRSELHWLAEQGLLSVEDVSGVLIAKLTRRGKDVADGAVVVPGVKRPEPEA
jgi:hypothetical protein